MTDVDSTRSDRISRQEVLRVVLVALTYFLAYRVAFLFPDSEKAVAAVWPASGIGLAAFLLHRRGLWPAILLALSVAGLSASLTSGSPFVTSAGFMVANVAESAACAWLISRYRGLTTCFSTVKEVAALIAAATGVNACTAFIGAGTAALIGRRHFPDIWLTWWVADGLGILLITPLIVQWADFDGMRRWRFRRYMEFGLFMAGWCVAAWWTFQPVASTGPRIQPYVLLALLAWPALRLGPRSVTLALAVLAAITLTSKAVIAGPLLWGGATLVERTLAAQMFLGCISAAGLLLAASYAETKDAETQLRALGDNLPNGAVHQFVLEPDGRMRFLYMSANVEQLLGVSAGETLRDAAALIDLIVEEDRPTVVSAMNASAAGMGVFNVFPRLRLRDGGIRWLHLSSLPRRMSDGRILWDGIMADVTAAQLAERELRASEERYRLLVHNSELPVLVVALADDRVVFVNESAAAFLNAPVAETMGRPIPEFWCDPAERDRCMGILAAEGKVTGFEAELRTDSGEKRWASISANLIEFEGQRVSFSVFSDITAVKRAQTELERERTFLKTLIQTIPDPVWLKDPDGVYTVCNSSAERLFRVPAAGIIGRSDYDFFPAEDAEFNRRKDNEAIVLGGPIVNQEWMTLPEDGRRVLLEKIKTPLRDQSERLIGVLGVGRDVTAAHQAQELLRERVALQERLEQIAATAPGGIYSFRLRADGSVSMPYASPAFEDTWGPSPEDLEKDASAVFAGIHPDDVGRVKATIAESAESLSTWRVDFRVLHPSKGWVWVEGHSVPAREPDGSTLWNGFIVDITERKRMELALAEEAVRRRILVEQSKDGIAVLDMEGRVCEANASFAAMLGYTQEELLRLHVWDWEAQSTPDELLRKITDPAFTAATFERRHRRKDGSVYDVEISVSGALVHGRRLLYCVFRDISRRKAAEDALRGSEERYRHLVENGTEGIWQIDAEGRTTFANPRMAGMLGYTVAEMLGRPFFDSMDPATGEMVAARLEGSGRDASWHNVTLKHKDGRPVPVLVSERRLFDDEGRYAGALGMVTDLTEYKRIEERLSRSQKAESIALLAGGVAHDFNNLLTPVLGFAEMLRVKAAGQDREMLDAIIRASQTAADLTRQLLAYSGKGQMVVRHVDIAGSVEEMRGLLRASIHRNVDLRLSLKRGLATVKSDPGQIQQIIMNMVINGAEAVGNAEPGSVTVVVRDQVARENEFRDHVTGNSLPAGGYVAIEVTDSGCGMTEDVRTKIFDPFFTTKFTGRGLGLAAVAGITQSLGGGVQVETSPGSGSTFRVLLPGSNGKAKPRAVPAPSEKRDGGTILVADDEPMILALLDAVLRQRGYEILTARDGGEAIRIFDENPRVTGVVLDLTMPLMNGKETLEALTSRRSNLPVLLMSGYNETEALRGIDSRPGVGFVQKPFDVPRLLEKIESSFRN